MKFVVQTGHGHLGEIQITLRALTEVPGTHEIYETPRTIVRRAAMEGRGLTSEETAEVEWLRAEKTQLNDEAFASVVETESTTVKARSRAKIDQVLATPAVLNGVTPRGLMARLQNTVPDGSRIENTGNMNPLPALLPCAPVRAQWRTDRSDDHVASWRRRAVLR